MPLAGLIDAKGKMIPWGQLTNKYVSNNWAINPEVTGGILSYWPRPFLAGLKRHGQDEPAGIREHFNEGVVYTLRVSALIIGPRRAALQARFPYYATPESLLYIVDGEAFHSWMAEGAPRDAEKRYSLPVPTKSWGVVHVTGQVDLIDYQFNQTVELKKTGVYGLKRCIENGVAVEHPEWLWQTRFYRLILQHNLKRELSPAMRIFVMGRDWRTPWPNKAPDPRVAEFIVVPTEQDAQHLKRCVLRLLKAWKMPEPKMPPCDDRHQYGVAQSGLPKRCEEYCPVKQFCSPYFRGKV